MGEAFAADPSILKEIELVSKTGIYLTEVDGATFGYYNTTKERVLQSCKESLKKLHADHLDLYLIHREDPLLNPWDTAEALLQLKKEGLVREIGVSNFDPYKSQQCVLLSFPVRGFQIEVFPLRCRKSQRIIPNPILLIQRGAVHKIISYILRGYILIGIQIITQ